MTDYDDLCKQLIAASHDERLSTGMLYREAADAIAALRVERDAAFALLRVCQDSVHPDTRTVILALIGDAALAGKEKP